MGTGESHLAFEDNASKEDPGKVERLEFWTRPLNNPVAAAAGGLHSFLVIRTNDTKHHRLEKLVDGKIHVRVIDRVKMEITKRPQKMQILKAARIENLRSGLHLRTIRRWARRHEGDYDVHSANCHRMVANLKFKISVPQTGLSYIASMVGIGASTRIATSKRIVIRDSSEDDEKVQRDIEWKEIKLEIKERINRYRQYEREKTSSKIFGILL
eukprot:jgi/Bigna1/87222/estExt_fgenesh1_pg.C_180012